MALPLIAAGIAARAVAKKLTSRAVGGIVGAGAKTVNPVYRNTGSVKVQSRWPGMATTKDVNKYITQKTNDAASGAAAKRAADNTVTLAKIAGKKKSPTVKINTNPMRGK